MNKELLQKAAKSLTPTGVFLRSSKVSTHPEFHPQMGQQDLQVQYKARPLSEYKLMLDDEGAQSLVVFYFEAGIRLVDDSVDEKNDGFVKVEVVATFASEYRHTKADGFDGNAMSEFLNHNVRHHVWPYWREYVQSTCMRMGLPVVPVPHQFYGTIGPPTVPKKKKGKKKKS